MNATSTPGTARRVLQQEGSECEPLRGRRWRNPGTAWAMVAGLGLGLRPRQWVKNVLVVAAPAAAGVLFDPEVLVDTAVAFVAFSACASAGYMINDAADVEADRKHPVKRLRPVASGLLPVPAARAAGVALGTAGVVGGGLLVGPGLSLVLAVYLFLTWAYSSGLKHVAVVELLLVAAGFVLRPLSGAAATEVSPSPWFLVVVSFGSLYMVAGKRHAEMTTLGDGASGHRRILGEYPAAFLRQTRELALGVTLLAYCVWAFESGTSVSVVAQWWEQLSVVPFTFGLLRYALLLERGQGGAPEDVVLRDRPLLASGAIWLVIFALGVLDVGLP